MTASAVLAQKSSSVTTMPAEPVEPIAISTVPPDADIPTVNSRLLKLITMFQLAEIKNTSGIWYVERGFLAAGWSN